MFFVCAFCVLFLVHFDFFLSVFDKERDEYEIGWIGRYGGSRKSLREKKLIKVIIWKKLVKDYFLKKEILKKFKSLQPDYKDSKDSVMV